jgi:hypothetical protein
MYTNSNQNITKSQAGQSKTTKKPPHNNTNNDHGVGLMQFYVHARPLRER